MHRLQESLPLIGDRTFWNEELWCLFDAKMKVEYDLSPFPYEECNFVLSTSPRRGIFNDFKKAPPVRYVYMPTWLEDEMGSVAPLFGGPAQARWMDRFAVLGGVTRLVFEVHDCDATSIVMDACTNTNLQGIINRIWSQAVFTERNNLIHALIHITSDAICSDSSLQFASNVAMTIVVARLSREMKQKIRTFLASYDSNCMIAQLTEYFFEKQAINPLEKGGNFTYRRLAGAASKATSASTQHTQAAVAETHLISIPASTRVIVNDVEPGQQQGCRRTRAFQESMHGYRESVAFRSQSTRSTPHMPASGSS